MAPRPAGQVRRERCYVGRPAFQVGTRVAHAGIMLGLAPKSLARNECVFGEIDRERGVCHKLLAELSDEVSSHV